MNQQDFDEFIKLFEELEDSVALFHADVEHAVGRVVDSVEKMEQCVKKIKGEEQ